MRRPRDQTTHSGLAPQKTLIQRRKTGKSGHSPSLALPFREWNACCKLVESQVLQG